MYHSKMDESVTNTLSLPVYLPLYQPPITYRYLSFDTYISSIPGPKGKPIFNLALYLNPVEWSKTSKGFTLYLSYIVIISNTYTADSYSLSARAISEEWYVSIIKVFFNITTFYIGYTIASIVFTPFNEIKKRYSIFLSVGIVYLNVQIYYTIIKSYFEMLF